MEIRLGKKNKDGLFKVSLYEINFKNSSWRRR